jgi:myo-inositol-1(or 4)-monophosphatase
MTSSDLLEFAVDLAREAGAFLRSAHGTIPREDVGYKGWRNLVTEVDVAVERLVGERIARAFPDHGILGEEGLVREGRSEHRWVVDPLDGTTNYVHRHPMYCVSIALEDAEGPLVGVVYAPHLEELFTARRGSGAHQNLASPLRVSSEPSLARSLLASGFAYGHGDRDANLDNWARLSPHTRGLRRCGAAALDLAYVADGRYDGFWELRLHPWDVAAGALLVTEAGGRVTDARGGDLWRDGSSIVASNGLVHEEIVKRIRTE